jgi:hypothetical protein
MKNIVLIRSRAKDVTATVARKLRYQLLATKSSTTLKVRMCISL